MLQVPQLQQEPQVETRPEIQVLVVISLIRQELSPISAVDERVVGDTSVSLSPGSLGVVIAAESEVAQVSSKCRQDENPIEANVERELVKEVTTYK